MIFQDEVLPSGDSNALVTGMNSKAFEFPNVFSSSEQARNFAPVK